jgi:hypothetical protein
MRREKMKAIDYFYTLILVLAVLGIIGWGMNLYKLFNCDFEAPYKCEAVHAVGIIPPVGAIAGWLDMGK